MAHMNGWIRGLVVLTVIWGVVVAYFAVDTFPTEEREQMRRAVALSNSLPSTTEDEAFDQECFDYYRNNHPAEALTCLKLGAERRLRNNEIRREAQERTSNQVSNEIDSIQTQHVGKAIAWWLLPIIGLYLLGLAAGWVRKGFHKVE